MIYFFIDLDGTIVDSVGRISPDVRDVFRKIRSSNRVFVATGRPRADLGVIDSLDIDGIISFSGAHIQVGDVVLRESCFLNDDCRSLELILNENEIQYTKETLDVIYATDKLFTGSCLDDYEPIAVRNFNNEPVFKYTVYSLGKLDGKIVSQIIEAGYRIRYSGELDRDSIYYLYDITLSNVSKANGVDEILNYFDDDGSKTIGIGDSLNDIEMIRHCNIGVAMGNADEKLKQNADLVIDTVDNNGIYYYLQGFINIQD